MTWDSFIGSLLGSSPLAGALAFAAWKLWTRLEQKDKQIEALHEARLADLRAIAKLKD